MKNHTGRYFIFMLLFVIFPLQRLVASPHFETMRVVDMLLLFASGMMAGVLIIQIKQHRNHLGQ